MGLFSNLFKGKKKDVVVNEGNIVQQVQPVQPIQQVQPVQPVQPVQSVQPVQPAQPMEAQPASSNDVATPNINGFPAMINTDPSNVLEQMQNRAMEEAAAEAQASESEGDPMDVFNQNISLDSENPMSVFGAEGQDNK